MSDPDVPVIRTALPPQRQSIKAHLIGAYIRKFHCVWISQSDDLGKIAVEIQKQTGFPITPGTSLREVAVGQPGKAR